MKKPVFESAQIVSDSMDVVGLVLGGLAPKSEIILSKIHKGIFTADIANELVASEGVPFRDAYKRAAGVVVGEVDLKKNISLKRSLGAPGNLALAAYRRRIKHMSRNTYLNN